MPLFDKDQTSTLVKVQTDILEIVQEIKVLSRTMQDLLNQNLRNKEASKELKERNRRINERLIKVEAQLELLTHTHIDIVNVAGDTSGDLNIVGKNQVKKDE